MIKKIYSHVCTYLLNFAELQLVITLMSLPILICWGIPISSMSLLSNLIFTPLLILFLWISAIFACCALIGIPCQYIANIIGYLTQFWIWLLSFSKPTWFLGFSFNIFWCSIIICIAIFAWYMLRKPNTLHSIIFLTFCMCMMLAARYQSKKPFLKKIDNLNMIAMHIAGKNYLFDYGALCCKQNFYSNIDYTIIPELIKQTGMTTIDTLILCKPSKRLAQVAWQFAKQTNAATIFAPKKLQCSKTLQMINDQENQNKKIMPINHQNLKSSSPP